MGFIFPGARLADLTVRGIHWRALDNGAWQHDHRGDTWIVWLGSDGHHVAHYPWGKPRVECWHHNGTGTWSSPREAMDAVAEVLVAPLVGGGI